MSNHTVEIPIWITSDYLKKMLQSFYGENSITVKNFDIAAGSAVGDNYIGQVLRIQVEYIRKNKNKKRSIIAKALPQTDLSKEFKKNFDVFTTEMNMLSETLELLYKELNAKIESERFFPYTYYSDVENSIIFMEDLKADGYILRDRKLSLDLEHVLLVIKAVAKMHASSYLLFRKNPTHKEKYLQWFWKRCDSAFPAQVVDGSFNYVIKFLNLYPISEEDKNIFRSFEGKLSDLMTETYERKESNFNVLLHGDCWTTNIMFKYVNDEVSSVKLLDYQVSNYNALGLDLNYFLFTSAMEYVKIRHLEDVFKTYYDTFVGITGEIEGFTEDTVREEFIKGLGFGFVIAATFRCTMTAEEGFDLDSVMEGKECLNNDKMFQRKEFISELTNLLPIFKKHGIFKLQL